MSTFSECLLEHKSKVKCAEDISPLLNQICRKFSNIDHITYLGLNVPGFENQSIVFTTYITEWHVRYREQKFEFVDPTINMGLQSLLPLDWSLIPQNTPKLKKFFGEASEFGISPNGISVPIRGRFGERSLFSVNSDLSKGDWNDFHRYNISDITYCAFLLHDLVVSILLPKEFIEPVILSPREIEVLKWTAEGKTSWEMSKILSLSDRTIDVYISNACAKLSVVNRTQAIAKAYSLGILPR